MSAQSEHPHWLCLQVAPASSCCPSHPAPSALGTVGKLQVAPVGEEWPPWGRATLSTLSVRSQYSFRWTDAVLLGRSGQLPSSLEPKNPFPLCQDPRTAFSIRHLYTLDAFLVPDLTLGEAAHLHGA